MSPVAQADGHEGLALCEEAVPGVASGVEDDVVGFEDAVGQPGLAQVLLEVLDRVQLGRPGRQQIDREALRDGQLVGLVPAGAIHQDDGVGAGGDSAADLIEVELHHGGVGPGQHESRTFAQPRADRAEQVGVGVALVGRQARPTALACPEPDASVLLVEPGLVLEPDLDALVLGQMGYVGPQRAREVLLKPSITRSSCPGCCGRPLIWEKASRASRSEIARSL